MTREDALRKIAGLVALALDQEGTPEGTAAARQADRLRERFEIQPGEEDTAEASLDMVRLSVPASKWRRHLYTALAYYNGCVFTFSRSVGYLAGERTDIEITRYLFEVVLRQLEAGLQSYARRAIHNLSRKERTTYRESFVAGLEHKVHQLMEARAARAADGDQYALVPAGRYEKAKEFRDSRAKVRLQKSALRDGNFQGLTDGSQARLTPGIGSSRRAPDARLLGGVFPKEVVR